MRPGRKHRLALALAWAGGVACLTALAAYCVYQVRMPELQKRKKEAAHQKFVRLIAVRNALDIARAAGSMLLDDDGNVKEEALRHLFDKYDEDRSGTIDREELRKMMSIISSTHRKGAGAEDLEEDLVYIFARPRPCVCFALRVYCLCLLSHRYEAY